MRTTLTLLLAVFVSSVPLAQDLVLTVFKGRRATQGTSGFPIQRSDTTAFYFDAEATGVSPFEPVRDLVLRLPDSSTSTIPKLASGDYAIRTDFATETAAQAAFPNGRYQFEAGFNLIGRVSAHCILPAPDYPPFPSFSEPSRSLSVDVNSDYTLSWQEFLNPGSGDKLQLRIVDGSTRQIVVEEMELDPSSTERILAPGTLAGGRTYSIQLAYARLADAGELEPGELVPVPAYWVSETTLTIRTSAGTEPVDQTPPTLLSISPSDGTTQAHATDGVIFQFSEPMDASRNRITWKAIQNGQRIELLAANFTLFWAPDRRSLVANYNPSSGGWPAGVLIGWEINPLPGAEGNLRDLAGNELAFRSGGFLTAGGPDPCAAQASTSNSGSAFAFFKLVNYQQASAGTPAADLVRGAQAFTFINLPDSVPVQTIVTLKVPTTNPFAFKLKVLSPPAGATRLGFRVLQEQFPARSDLDEAYPEGAYQMELRNSAAQSTNSSSLTVTANGYPPIPHVSNFAACQAVQASEAFSVSWDPFSGATTNRESVTFNIFDRAGNLVFHAPDPCNHLALDPAASGITLPAGTLTAGTNYSAELTFSRLTDTGKTLSTISGFGIAALTRITRFPIATLAGRISSTSPQFTRISQVDENNLQIELKCSTGSLLTLESTPALGSAWTTLLATNPPGNQLTLKIAKPGTSVFIRAKHP